MTIFYHVDRAGRLRAGQVMNLTKIVDDDRPEVAAQFNEVFPDGVSHHAGYLLGWENPPGWATRREVTLENIRRNHYPDLPSRCTSIFACGSIESADRLRTEGLFGDRVSWSYAHIWKVEADQWFMADMNVFAHWGYENLESGAHAYWQREISPNPFFEFLLKPPVRVREEVIYIPEIEAKTRFGDLRIADLVQSEE